MTTVLAYEGIARVSADFPDFYRGTFADLSSYAWSLTRDAHLADELAQEALTRVYARWGLLRDPRPYAFRIVANLATDAWRQRRRTGVLPPDELTADTPVAGPDEATLDAVRRLPRPLREVVLLHYYADLPVAEVAKVVRRPVGTVKRRLHEARGELSRALEESR